MICPNCNSEVKDGMRFCPKCGTEIPQIRYCSECGTELKDGMRFCPKCGVSILLPLSNQIVNKANCQLAKNDSSHQKSPQKYLLILGFILVIMAGAYYLNNSNHEKSYDSSLYSTPDESDIELENAENDLLDISNRAYDILPKVDYVMSQYGYSTMGYLTASQNNPQLFRNFENVISDYNNCLNKLISLYEQKGLSEMANSYRAKKQKWDEGCRRVKGMY